MEMEPDGSQCWKTSANYAERQLDIRPEEDRCRVVYDIVGVLYIFFRDRVCSDDASNAYCAHTASVSDTDEPSLTLTGQLTLHPVRA